MSSRVSGIFKAKANFFPNLSEGFSKRPALKQDELAHYGIAGKILKVSFDQVQSLLAVATTKHVYVYGQNGVEVVFDVPSGRLTAHLALHGSHLVVIDEKYTLYTWNLEEKGNTPIAVQALRGVVTAHYVEPATDWLFLGMRDGTVEVWDLAGEQMNRTFKIKNPYLARQEEWRLMDEWYAVSKHHVSSVISICVHPLDLGMMLITYADGACLYSLKDNSAKRFYECIIAPDRQSPPRKPALTCATFSPTGEYVVLGCVDGTFAFFDYKEAEYPLQVRTLAESDVNLPRKNPLTADPTNPPQTIVDLKWCCRQDTTDTFLLVAGGSSFGITGVTLLDYGKAPIRTQELAAFFATPQRQRILPINPELEVKHLEPLGTASPYYQFHDPRCILAITTAGLALCLALPSGETFPSVYLPSTLALAMPNISTFTASANVPRHALAHMHNSSTVASGLRNILLQGGAAAKLKSNRLETREILCTVHDGRYVRLSDISDKELFHPVLYEIDASLILPKSDIEQIVYSGATNELVIGSETGTVALYRGKISPVEDGDLNASMIDYTSVRPMPSPDVEADKLLYKFDTVSSPGSGFLPLFIVHARRGQISCLSLSAVGFLVVGYESGFLIIIDMRGPAIFYTCECGSVTKRKEKGFFKSKDTANKGPGTEFATAASIMSTNVEGRLSLTAIIGTNLGRYITFELLRENNGAYSAIFGETGISQTAGAVRHILGCNAYGENTQANASHLATLYTDTEISDCLLLVTDAGITSLTGLGKKSAKAVFRGSGAACAEIVQDVDYPGVLALAVAQISGGIELYSIPELDLLSMSTASAPSQDMLPYIDPMGNVVSGSRDTGLMLTAIFGSGQLLKNQSSDLLYDALKSPAIPRPTISNWAWVTGTQYIRPADFDLIISGGERPLSKNAQERLAASERQQALLERQAAARDKTSARLIETQRNTGGYDRGTGRSTYGAMQQSGQERGERVGQVSEMYENIAKASGDMLTEMEKLTTNAKKSAGKAMVRNFLGF